MRLKRMLLMMMTLCLAMAVPAVQAESLSGGEPTCRVWINGNEVQVMQTAVNHRRVWTSRPMMDTTPVVVAAAQGEVKVEVAFDDAVDTALVRPLALGAEAVVQDGRVCFTLQAPVNAVVEYNGGVAGALHLFLNAPEADAPAPDAPGVHYFGPGEHVERQIVLGDGESVYLAEGCVLHGSIYANGAKDIAVCGPGIISGMKYDRFADTLVPINFENCENVSVEGITILDPSAWTLNLYKCRNALVQGVKIIGSRSNSDGVTMQSCEHVLVKDCFVRSWDDSIVIKGYDGNVDDITVENTVIWTDLAQSCEIGYETRADVIENIIFRDITVLHNFHKPVLSIHNSDRAQVRNVLYQNIVVEDAQMGEGDGQPFLIDLGTTKSQWSKDKQRGTIRNVTFDGVYVLSGKEPSVRIFSFSKECNVDDVQIKDLYILGNHITDFDMIKYNKNSRNGANIGFIE